MTDGKFTAHANPAMMGTDVRALKAKDDPLGQKSSTRSTNHRRNCPHGRHNFPKPGTTEPVPKQSFVTKVDDQGSASAITDRPVEVFAAPAQNRHRAAWTRRYRFGS